MSQRKIYLKGRMEEQFFIGSPYMGISEFEKAGDRYEKKLG